MEQIDIALVEKALSLIKIDGSAESSAGAVHVSRKSSTREGVAGNIIVLIYNLVPFAEFNTTTQTLITTAFFPKWEQLRNAIEKQLETKIKEMKLCTNCRHKLACEYAPRHNIYGYCDTITVK